MDQQSWTLLLFQLLATQVFSQNARPFYLFAHMVQTIEVTNKALSEGANAVEVDVQFTKEGQPVKTFHGFPCDCFRDCFGSSDFVYYLNSVRDLGIPGSQTYNKNMTMLYLDLKLDGIDYNNLQQGGENLATVLADHYFDQGKPQTLVNLIIGIPGIKFEPFVIGFLRIIKTTLQERIGFDFSGDDDLESIKQTVRQLELRHVWQGRGASNCFVQTNTLVKEAIAWRDGDDSMLQKVYSWTIDAPKRMRCDLRSSIDGIMTNDVSTAFKVLHESEFNSKYRMATNEDIPWQRHVGDNEEHASCGLLVNILKLGIEIRF